MTPSATPQVGANGRIPADIIPLPADIASAALAAKGGTTTHAMDAIAYSVAAHLHGDIHHMWWDAMLHDTMYSYRMYASHYIEAHFSSRYDIWDGLTFDELNTGDAKQFLGHLIERATKELAKTASGTATTLATTKDIDVIAMKNDTRNDRRAPVDYYYTPNEVAEHATAAGATEQDVINAVTWMSATDLLTGHHPLIPFHQVRAALAESLTADSSCFDTTTSTWDWDAAAHRASLRADDALFQGVLVERARLHGEAMARVQVGAVITERAARRIWPEGADPSERYNPDSLARYEALRDERNRIVSAALTWAEKCTTHNPTIWDVAALDLLSNAETRALMDHLAEAFPTEKPCEG